MSANQPHSSYDPDQDVVMQIVRKLSHLDSLFHGDAELYSFTVQERAVWGRWYTGDVTSKVQDINRTELRAYLRANGLDMRDTFSDHDTIAARVVLYQG